MGTTASAYYIPIHIYYDNPRVIFYLKKKKFKRRSYIKFFITFLLVIIMLIVVQIQINRGENEKTTQILGHIVAGLKILSVASLLPQSVFNGK